MLTGTKHCSLCTTINYASLKRKMGVVVPSNLKQLLFHDNNVAQPAYYTPQELEGSGLPHDAFLKDYSLGLGDLRPKQPGYCYNFDGVNNYINIGNVNTLNGLTQFTISVWVNLDVITDQRTFVCKGNYYVTNEFFFGLTHAGLTRLGYSIGLRYRFITVSSYLEGLNHVVLTYDSVNSIDRIYLNGVDLGNGTSGGTFASFPVNSKSLAIGARPDANNVFGSFLDGKLSDVQIYNYALTPQQVADLYTGTLPATKPIAHYPLQEESGPRAYDISGNGNHGTIMNATTSGVGSIHVADAGVKKSYPNNEGYTPAFTVDDTLIAANVSGTNNTLSFDLKIDPSDTAGIPFSSGDINAFFLCYQSGSTSTINFNTAISSILIDNVEFTGNRNDLYLILSDGEFHTFLLTGLNLSLAIWSPGLYFSGYSPGGNFDMPGSVLKNVELNGVPIPGPNLIPNVSDTESAIGTTPQFTGRVSQYGLAKGPAWQGDGSSVYVDLGSPIIPATADFELEFWYYHTTNNATRTYLLDQWTTGLPPGRLVIITNSKTGSLAEAGAIQCFINASTNADAQILNALRENSWHKIRLTRSSNNFTFSVKPLNQEQASVSFTVAATIASINTQLLGGTDSTLPTNNGRISPVTITTGGVTTTYSPIQGTRNVAVTKSDGTYSVISNAVVNGTLANLYTTGNGSWRLPAIENGAHWDGTSLIPAAPGAEVAANGNAINIPANKHPRSVLVDRTGAVITPLDTAMGTDDLTNEQFNDISPEVTINKRGLSIYAADRYGASLENIQ